MGNRVIDPEVIVRSRPDRTGSGRWIFREMVHASPLHATPGEGRIRKVDVAGPRE